MYSIDIKVMAFLRMNNPEKKELTACVKQMALVSLRKVRGKKTTYNFMNVLHERRYIHKTLERIGKFSDRENHIDILDRNIRAKIQMDH